MTKKIIIISYNDPNRPFVMGSLFNGKIGAGGQAQNNIKSIFTRTGSTITFDEGASSILVKDPSGNSWFMDGAGNIEVTAPKNITMNAGENISITAGQNITTSAALNISESAGVNKATTVGALNTMFVGGDSMMNVMGKLTEMITGERKTQAKKAIIQHESHEMNIEKDKNIHTEGKFEVNSTEKSKLF